MRRLTLREYKPSRVPFELSVDERDLLREIASSITISPAVGQTNAYYLTPSSYVGVVQLPTLTIVIRPKLPMKRVVFLISYAIDRARWDDDSANLKEATLVDAVAPALVSHTRRAFCRGLLQGYRTEEDALTTIRGRVRFDEQIRRRLGVFPPVEVRFDEFTEDIEANRLIKAAIARLVRMPLRSPGTLRALHNVGRPLERVQLVDYPRTAVPEITYSRLNEHYRPAVELARAILRSCSFKLRHGKVGATSFLVDMNKVFEDFVVIALRDALRVGDDTFPQGAKGHDLRLDRERHVRLLPDISWWEGGRCVFVGDVKYKRVELAGFQNADIYQLLAYATAADLPGGLLIYAQGEHSGGTYTVRHANKSLEVATLSPKGEPDEILRQIAELARRIQELRALGVAAKKRAAA